MSGRRSPSSPAGLQQERTALAWERTSLAVLANGVLVLMHRASVDRPAPARLVVCAYALGLAAAIMFVALRSRRAATDGHQSRSAGPSVGLVVGCGLGQALLAVLVLALALPGLA